jgi:hypothetical protein
LYINTIVLVALFMDIKNGSMNNQTEVEKYYKTKRWFLIGLVLAAIVIILLVWNGCRQSKNMDIKYALIKDTLQSVIADTARINAEAKRLSRQVGDLEADLADVVADREVMHGALIDESDKSVRLARELKAAKAKKDTTKYHEKCDSLADEMFSLKIYIEDQERFQRGVDSAYTALLGAERRLKDLYYFSYDSCKKAAVVANTELPAIKPRGKWYIDAAAITGPVTGAGGGLSYIDTKGNKFGAKAYATNAGPLYQAEYGRLLSLKRK